MECTFHYINLNSSRYKVNRFRKQKYRMVNLIWTSDKQWMFSMKTSIEYLGCICSSALAWKIPWTEEPMGCSPWSHWGSDMTKQLHFDFSLSCTGEGNGNPLQCSCLENPRDGGAWWAAVYGVALSRTQLKRLSRSSSRDLNVTGLPICVPV